MVDDEDGVGVDAVPGKEARVVDDDVVDCDVVDGPSNGFNQSNPLSTA